MSSEASSVDGKQEMPLPTAICGGSTLAPHQQRQRYGLCAALSCAVLLCAWLTGLHDPVLELAYAARGGAADHHASGGGGGGMATGWRVVKGEEAPVPSAIARALTPPPPPPPPPPTANTTAMPAGKRVIPAAGGPKDDDTVCKHELLVGVDFFGHDVGSATASSAAECCVLCQNFPRCGAFSHIQETCWFKSSTAAETKLDNPKCTSGWVRETAGGGGTRRRRSSRSRRPVDEALPAVLSEPEPETEGDSDGAPTMPPPPPPPPCNDSAGSPPTAATLGLPVAPELQPPGFFDGIGRWVWHDAAQIPRRCPPAQNGECGWTWEDASTGEVWEEDAQHRFGQWEAFNQVGSAVADPSHCP
eukprot:COSAG01_NODE_2281_length_8005_cov_4.513408_7_plen_360_part_00